MHGGLSSAIGRGHPPLAFVMGEVKRAWRFVHGPGDSVRDDGGASSFFFYFSSCYRADRVICCRSLYSNLCYVFGGRSAVTPVLTHFSCPLIIKTRALGSPTPGGGLSRGGCSILGLYRKRNKHTTKAHQRSQPPVWVLVEMWCGVWLVSGVWCLVSAAGGVRRSRSGLPLSYAGALSVCAASCCCAAPARAILLVVRFTRSRGRDRGRRWIRLSRCWCRG